MRPQDAIMVANSIVRVIFLTAGLVCTYHLLNCLELERIAPKLTRLGRFLIIVLIGWLMYAGLWGYLGNLQILLRPAQLIETPFPYALYLAESVIMLVILLIVYRQLGKGGGTSGE